MDEVFELYCPVCGKLMKDISYLDPETGLEYPFKQCKVCLTIYQLGSESSKGAITPQEVLLIPKKKKWIKKYGKNFKDALL